MPPSSFPNSAEKTEDIYKNLNDRQRKAVQAFEGPVLVLAGAGSGKTRVLVCRIAGLILERKIPLENILAVTFTNKAAREMKERAIQLLGGIERSAARSPWIGTFHSIAAQILRRNIDMVPDRRAGDNL